MKPMKYLFTIVLFFAFNISHAQEVNHDLLVQNVTIIDVKTGNTLPGRSVGIDGDKIAKIYETLVQASSKTKTIDASGKFMIPGLWDMHAHYFWNYKTSNPALIANGVTGIREMWGNMDVINMVRKQTAEGKMIAPDIYSAGVIIDGTPPIWPGSSGVGNAEEAIAEVDKQIAQGVDFLKVYSRLTREAYFAIADKSKSSKTPFAGHIPSSISIWEAMEAGQYSSEHMYGILEAVNSKPEELAAQPSSFSERSMQLMIDNFDADLFDSLATVMAKSNMWLSPTLTVLRSIANLDDSTFTNDPRLKYVPAFMTSTWNPANDFRFKNRPASYYEASRKSYKFQLSLMGKLAAKGVKIVAGTDYANPYCFPGFSLHDELALMVEGGMSTLQALQAATINAAIFQKKEAQFGTVANGKLASLVLLNENPLNDISNTKKIDAVILRGKLMDRKALDGLLESAQKLSGN